MATLTGSKVKDTYQSLLKLESGTASSTYKIIEDGQGNDTGLKISTGGVEVGELKFTTDPTASSTELTALVYNGTTKTVETRDLNANAFTGNLSSAIIIARVESDYTYTTSYGTPTIADVDNDSETGSYQFGSTGDITLDGTEATITINADGVYRVSLSANTVTTNSNTTITFKLMKSESTLLEISREKATAGTYMDSYDFVQSFRSGDIIEYNYKASGSGATLKEKSLFEVQRIQ
jgi:hypothetical protein